MLTITTHEELKFRWDCINSWKSQRAGKNFSRCASGTRSEVCTLAKNNQFHLSCVQSV